VAKSGAILQEEIKTARLTKAGNGWRRKGKNLRIADLIEGLIGPTDNCCCAVPGAGPVFPVLERDKADTDILARAGKTESGNGKVAIHGIAFIVAQMGFHLVKDGERAFIGGAGRKLRLQQHQALILFRQK